jgi:lysophospholipase L1-like esterase
MRRAIVVVLAVLVLCGVGVLWHWHSSSRSQVKAPSTIGDYVGTGPRVAVIGDSITFLSVDAINAALRPRFAPGITAVIGIKTDAQLVTAKRYAATHPDIVVIDLGTNDVTQHDAFESYRHELGSMVGLFPQSCVVVTTITTHTPGDDAFAQRAAKYNEYLRTFPHVADWDAVVGQALQAGQHILTDLVHPNPAGQRLYAGLVAQAVSACH